MAKFIIVRRDDLSIQGSYDADVKDDTSANRSWLHAEPVCMHLEMPEGLDPECIKCENDEIVEDAEKVADKLQAQREAKLSLMRSQRDVKLKEVDIMINELALAERSDSAAIAAYRTALKAITDDYKEQDGSASADCDALEADLSDLVWPTAP